MIDWNILFNIFTITVTIVSGLGALLTAWNKYVYKPALERREHKEEERNQKLIKAYEEFSQPMIELVTKNDERTDKLEEVAEQSMKMHDEWRNKFDQHDRRIWELERTTKDGKTTLKYKEIHEGENN